MTSHSLHVVQDERSPGDLLRRAGLRATDTRVRILEVLAGATTALTAGEVIERVEAAEAGGVGRAGLETGRGKAVRGGKRRAIRADKVRADKVTVYRTLNALVESNLAHRVDTGDRVFRYSLTDHSHCHGDEHDHDHPHVVCDECGKVECIEGAEVTVVHKAPQAKGRAGGATAEMHDTLSRFRVTRQDVTLHGVCDDCRR